MKRKVKTLVLLVLKGLGGFRLARWLTRNQVRILCYHGIWLGEPSFRGDGLFMNASTFSGRMEHLAEAGYPVISLTDAMNGLFEAHHLPPCSVVLTIDDGWVGVQRHMLPILKKHGFAATLYVDTQHVEFGEPIPHILARYLPIIHKNDPRLSSGDFRDRFVRATDLERSLQERQAAVADLAAIVDDSLERYRSERLFSYMSPSELAAAFQAGLDIQLHTHTHSLHDFSHHRIGREIEINRAALAEILSVPPSSLVHFCYPSGRNHPACARVLAAHEVLSATTTERGFATHCHSAYYLPRLLDSEKITSLEFEAEMSGVLELFRRMRDTFFGLREAGPSEPLCSAGE